MQKYLSIYLTTNSAAALVSATQVTGVDMAATNQVKIWYHDGGSATFTLSDHMAANDISASNYIADQIAALVGTSWTNVVKEVTTAASQAIPGIEDAASVAVTVSSVVIA